MRFDHQSKRKQECIPLGCLPSIPVAVSGGGCLPRGVSAWGGCKHLPDPEADTLLWTEFLTHACEKITFLQLLLQTVKMWKLSRNDEFWPKTGVVKFLPIATDLYLMLTNRHFRGMFWLGLTSAQSFVSGTRLSYDSSPVLQLPRLVY